MLGTIAAIIGIAIKKPFLTAAGVGCELPSLFSGPSVMVIPDSVRDCKTLDNLIDILHNKTHQEYKNKIMCQIFVNVFVLAFLFFIICTGTGGWQGGLHWIMQDLFKVVGIFSGANALFALAWYSNRQCELYQIKELERVAKEKGKALKLISIGRLDYYVEVSPDGNVNVTPFMLY